MTRSSLVVGLVALLLGGLIGAAATNRGLHLDLVSRLEAEVAGTTAEHVTVLAMLRLGRDDRAIEHLEQMLDVQVVSLAPRQATSPQARRALRLAKVYRTRIPSPQAEVREALEGIEPLTPAECSGAVRDFMEVFGGSQR